MIAFGSAGDDLLDGRRVRHDLGVDLRLAHSPGDQLRVLGPEVDHDDQIVLGLAHSPVPPLLALARGEQSRGHAAVCPERVEGHHAAAARIANVRHLGDAGDAARSRKRTGPEQPHLGDAVPQTQEMRLGAGVPADLRLGRSCAVPASHPTSR